MKILIPTADYPPIEGGISTVTLHLSRELAALGHEVTVVAPWFAGVKAFDDAEPVHVKRFHGYNLGWARLAPMAAACATELRRTDLVLAINIAYGGLIGRGARRLFGTPYITFGYGYEFLKFGQDSLAASMLRSVYRTAAMTVAISQFTRDALVKFGLPDGGIELCLPGAVPASPPCSAAIGNIKRKLNLNGHRLVLSVGRMVPRKGHLTLVRAMRPILDRHPDTMLVCAGRGPCLGEAEQLATLMNISDNVRFPGHLSDGEINTLYSICDVFALPAGEGPRGQVEGFGLVFAEAAAHGKPVVAGRSGGVPDAVRDGETGLLVAPEDTNATAAAINRLLSDRAYAAQLGEAGRKRVETELNWPAFTRTILEAYARRA
jgi:phosphatidylinositol alpha-1,6-mannosyltransferase